MNLINFLKQNQNSRKVFGKRELKIIEKQLLGINLTQSEKNRLSRDIRPKFEFIEKCSRFCDDFKLKKGNEITKLVQETKEIILNDKLSKDIEKIILFGSLVENKLTFNSDIDLAVKFKKINLRESTLFRKRILGRTNKKMDVQVFNFVENKIKKEIEKKGVVIYGK